MFGMIPFDRSDNNIFDLFDNFEKQFFNNTNASLPAFRTDIRDQGDKFLLEAELPGFNKEDISLDLKEGILTIKAEHKDSQDQKNDKGEYIRRERRYGSFRRSFDVTGIDENGITYTPKENAAGGDSFTYSAANSAGAVSLPATVTVTIEKTRSGVTYADTGEATATAAQDLAERGVFTGAKIGDKWYFEPDRTVSRGEFLAMVLETAGAEVTDVTMTGFRDDDAIPTWAKSYAAAGVAARKCCLSAL